MTQVIVQVAIPMLLGTIMFTMGLGLRPADFKRILLSPRPVVCGVFAQVVLLPLLGIGWAWAWGLDVPMALGLVLVASCPGGPSSNLQTDLARGNTALSITLTALSGVTTIFTIPLVMHLAIGMFSVPGEAVIELEVAGLMGQLFGVVGVPLGLGMWCRAGRPGWAGRLEPVLKKVAVGFLVVLVTGALIKERGQLAGFLEQAGLAVVGFNLAALAMGWGVGKLGRLDVRDRLTVTIEVGIQNGSMAISIALSIFGSSQVAIPGVIYGVWMYVPCACLIWWGRGKLAQVQG